MWAQIAMAVAQSGVLNAPDGGGIPPSVISGPTHGDWNVNLGGSGVAVQSGAATGMSLLLIGGIALGALWLLRK